MVSTGHPPPVHIRRDILRSRMRVLRLLIVPLPLLLFLPSTTERALAQIAPVPATGRAPIAGRVLTLDECVSIALEAQPTIQATLYDYAAARYRVTQALAPLLPQVSGLVTATKSESSTVSTFAPTGRLTQSQTFKGFSETFIAQVVLSQLLFDFGKNLAATEAARKLAEVAVEDVGLPRQLISLAVQEAYTDILFAGRLVPVPGPAVQRGQADLPAGEGIFQGGPPPRAPDLSQLLPRHQRQRHVRRQPAPAQRGLDARAEPFVVALRRRQSRRQIPGGEGQPRGREAAGEVHGARHHPERRAGGDRGRGGAGAYPGRAGPRRLRPGELPARAGPLRRRGGDDPRAHGRPAGAHTGAEHRGSGALRLPHRASSARSRRRSSLTAGR